jgi:hypothetical protein
MRIDGWPDRLMQVVEQHRAQPFVWGRTDCAMLFRHCVQVITGRDPLADLPPWYSAVSAARALHRVGHATAVDLVRSRLPSAVTWGSATIAITCPRRQSSSAARL